MRKLGSFPSRSDAETFHRFLLSKEIENQLDEVPPIWEIWVLNDDHLSRAQSELDGFLAAPKDPRFQVSLPKSTKKPVTPRRRIVESSRVPATRFLIAACIVLTIYTGLGARHPELINLMAYSRYVKTGPNWPLSPEIMDGQVWRLFSTIFIHLSAMHLLMNMYWMWILGNIIERKKGTAQLIVLTLLTAAGASMTQYYIFGPAFFGISGVVYGLLGYIWMKSMVAPEEGLWVPESLVIFMLAWLFLGVTGSLDALGMRIANGTHFGGLVTGMLIATFPRWR